MYTATQVKRLPPIAWRELADFRSGSPGRWSIPRSGRVFVFLLFSGPRLLRRNLLCKSFPLNRNMLVVAVLHHKNLLTMKRNRFNLRHASAMKLANLCRVVAPAERSSDDGYGGF